MPANFRTALRISGLGRPSSSRGNSGDVLLVDVTCWLDCALAIGVVVTLRGSSAASVAASAVVAGRPTKIPSLVRCGGT